MNNTHLYKAYILVPVEDDRISIRQLNGFECAKALIRNIHRPMFLRGQGLLGRHLEQCATVCNKCRVFAIHRPRSLFCAFAKRQNIGTAQQKAPEARRANTDE